MSGFAKMEQDVEEMEKTVLQKAEAFVYKIPAGQQGGADGWKVSSNVTAYTVEY